MCVVTFEWLANTRYSVAVVPVNFLRPGLPNNFLVQLFCITLVKDYVATTLPADHVTTAEK